MERLVSSHSHSWEEWDWSSSQGQSKHSRWSQQTGRTRRNHSVRVEERKAPFVKKGPEYAVMSEVGTGWPIYDPTPKQLRCSRKSMKGSPPGTHSSLSIDDLCRVKNTLQYGLRPTDTAGLPVTDELTDSTSCTCQVYHRWRSARTDLDFVDEAYQEV